MFQVAKKKKSKSPQTHRTKASPAGSISVGSRHGSVISLLPLPIAPRAASISNGEPISLQFRTSSPLPYLMASRGCGIGSSNEAAAEALLEARKRSGSVPVLKFNLAIAWNLKMEHIRALKVTWSRLCESPRSNCRGIFAIMERVFEKFECKEKTLKDVFYRSAFVDSMADCTDFVAMRNPETRRHSDTGSLTICANAANSNSIATLRDHIHFFVSLISQVVQSLEKAPQEIFEHIDRIGCYHAHLKRYGFRAAMWDKLGVCLIDGIVVQDCLRGFPDACRAWTIMVAALIDRLRSAPRNLSVVPLVNFRFRSRPLLVPPGSYTQQASALTQQTVPKDVEKQLVKFSLGCPVIADRSPLPMPLPKLMTQPFQTKTVNQYSQSACFAVKALPAPMNLANAMAVLGKNYKQQRRSEGEILNDCNQRSHSHQRFHLSGETDPLANELKNGGKELLKPPNNNNDKKNSDFNRHAVEIPQNSISQQNFFSSQSTFV